MTAVRDVLENPIDSGEDDATIDELVPRGPSATRRLVIALSLVAVAGFIGWLWSSGRIVPKPEFVYGSSTIGGVQLVDDLESDRVIFAGILVENHSSQDLVITDVALDGLPLTVHEVRTSSTGNPQGTPPREFFVTGTDPLPATVEPYSFDPVDTGVSEVVVMAMDDIETVPEFQVDIYIEPDCDADWPDTTVDVGTLSFRWEYPNRPSWWHRWVEFDQAIWGPGDPEGQSWRGLLSDSAIDANDEFVPITDLRSSMCDLAGVSS